MAVGLVLAALPQFASAAVINATSAAAVNNAPGGSVGTHYHLAPGNAAGVNSFFGEAGRGVAEFDLTGLGPFSAATLSFRVAGHTDLNSDGTPYIAPITLRAYIGNNAIAFSDFESATFADIDTFATAGLLIGDVLSFDITAELLAVLASSIGILLDGSADPSEFKAIVFDQIKITTVEGASVPEPMTLALLGCGLVGLRLMPRRARRV